MISKRKLACTAFAVLLTVFVPACQKKPPSIATPMLPKAEAPAPPKLSPPTIMEFTTEPKSIERGEYALLRWLVTEATEVSIEPGLGSVSHTGRQRISPRETIQYTLRANGPGGKTTASTTLIVTAAPRRPRRAPVVVPSLSDRIAGEVQDAYFDFDRSVLRPDATATLTANAAALKTILSDFPRATLILEGHCDERGSAEYNIGLGDRRASAAKEFLDDLGVPGERLLVITYGKERPQCTESNEDCWQKNRRVHLAVGENQTND